MNSLRSHRVQRSESLTMTRTRASTAPHNPLPPPPPHPPHTQQQPGPGGLVSQIPNNQNTALDWGVSPPTHAHSQPNLNASTHEALNGASVASRNPLPMLKFLPHRERNGRPSLEFQTVSRTLPRNEAIIRVGRYSERESQPELNSTLPSEAPVGFKSKVVSRRHCEFSYNNSQWYIKDVKSSSGTFLNHIRLSQPGVESQLYPVNDGDIVQLGIDFKGGEEMIFRCVKIRIECNRGWQKAINKFNKSTHRRLRELSRTTKASETDADSKFTTECTICLNSIAPCQALFVAPCSHTWHYKCIKPMLDDLDPANPQLLCPNCRARADLDADVDVPLDFDEWTDDESSSIKKDDEAAQGPSAPNGGPHELPSVESSNGIHIDSDDIEPELSEREREADQLAWYMSSISMSGSDAHNRSRQGSSSSILNPSASSFVPSPAPGTSRFPVRGASGDSPMLDRTLVGNISEALHGTGDASNMTIHEGSSGSIVHIDHPPNSLPGARSIPPVTTILSPRTLTPPSRGDHGSEGPMTPRNTAGPFVFDGGAPGTNA